MLNRFLLAFPLIFLITAGAGAGISADGVYTRSGTDIHIQIVDCGNPNCSLSSYYAVINQNLDLLPASQLLSIKTISSAPMDYTDPNNQHWYDVTSNSITLYVDYADKYLGSGCGKAYFAPVLLMNSVADQVYKYQLTPAQNQAWNAMNSLTGWPPPPSAEQQFIGVYDDWITDAYRVLVGVYYPNGLYIPSQDVFFMAGVMTDPTTHQMTYNRTYATPDKPQCNPITAGSANITLKDGLLTIAGTNVFRVVNNAVTAAELPDGSFVDLTSPEGSPSPLPLPQILLDNAGLSSGSGRRPPRRPIPFPPPTPRPDNGMMPQLRVYTGSDPTSYIPLDSSEGHARLSEMGQALQAQNPDLGSPDLMTHQVTEH